MENFILGQLNPFASDVTNDTMVRPDTNPRGITPSAKFNTFTDAANTYIVLAEVFTYLKLSIPLLTFIIYFAQLYMVPMIPQVVHKLVSQIDQNLLTITSAAAASRKDAVQFIVKRAK